MKYIRLFLRMLRWQTALTLVLFMMIGAAWHFNPEKAALALFLGTIAVIASYASATSANDLADWKIDHVNLKGHAERPLVTGEATRNEIYVVALISAVISLAVGFLINMLAGMLILASLIVNVFYSLPPLKISHQSILTPPFLVVGYVVIPYLIGIAAVGSHIDRDDALFLPALFLLFLARISLKDFRDREGDAKFGKKTLILEYGKTAVCTLSMVSFIIGSVFLLAALGNRYWLMTGLAVYMAAILINEFRLLKASDRISELIAIGIGARMGNGMLFTLLGIILLQRSGATNDTQIIFYISITAVYMALFIEYLRHFDKFRFGNQKYGKVP